MTWFKVDDNLAFHAKTVAAGNAAMGLWVRAGSWCAQQLTDGHVPAHMLPALGKSSEAERLVTVGLWTAAADGFCFHDWHDRNPRREHVEEERAAARDRMQKARATKRSREQAPNVQPNTDRSSESVRVTHRSPYPDPTRPDPSLVLPSEVQTPKVKPSSPTTVDAHCRSEPLGFAEWYAAYPIHKGRKAAAAAYARALRTTSAEKLTTAAQALADDPTRTEAFTPHPATWLNQGRWDDEGPARPVELNSAEKRQAANLALIERFTDTTLPIDHRTPEPTPEWLATGGSV